MNEEALLIVDAQVAHVPVVVIQVELLAHQHSYFLVAIYARHWKPLGLGVRVDSLVVKLVLHKLLCIGHGKYVFVLEPFRYLLLTFARLNLPIALLEYYH